MAKQESANEVSKDVSAFLNSGGGVLIYGVPEDKNPDARGGAPIPRSAADKIGFQPNEVSKETVENLITSNVQPRPHPNLFQITEVQFCGRIVIVVEIEPGVGEVWQAKDHKYYKRFHYKVEPMTHDEINEVRRRKAVPDMWVVFGFDERWVKTLGDDHQELASIIVGIQNETDSPVESADIELGVPRTGYLLAPSGGPLRPVPFEEAGCRL